MPLTLQQELAVEQPKIRQAIIQTLVEVSPLARRVPMEATGNINVTGYTKIGISRNLTDTCLVKVF